MGKRETDSSQRGKGSTDEGRGGKWDTERNKDVCKYLLRTRNVTIFTANMY